MAVNNTQFGAVLSQITLSLADNTRLAGPINLRLGLYLGGPVSYGASSMSLMGQTAELTLYPSGPQLLYANLIQPVQLLVLLNRRLMVPMVNC